MSLYKLKEYDDLGENNILARVGTIRAFGHNIDTPSPIPTSQDLEKLIELKRAVAHLKKLDFTQPITEINKFYSPKMLANLEKSPSASERMKNQVEDICDHVNLSMLRLVISRDAEFTDKLNGAYTETQIQAQTSFLLINDRKFNAPINDFDKRMGNTREYIESHHDSEKYCAILPTMRMDMPMDLFKQKIQVAEDSGFEGIVFIHAPYYKAWRQYLYMQEIAKEKDIWLHLSGCTPVWHINKKTSMPHFYTSFFGFDTASVLHPRRFYKKSKDEKKPAKKKSSRPKFKKFNNMSWGIVEPPEWDNTCKCPIDKGHKSSSSFINAWHGSGLIFSALNYHNITDGHREMSIARKFIMHKELQEYLRRKIYIAESVRKVLGKDFKQSSLGRWIKKV